MLHEEIDKYIAEAIKAQDNNRLNTYRMIKAKFLEYKTSKGAKPIDKTIEIQLLRKMISERKDAISMYIEGGRKELAEKEDREIHIIQEFLPEEVSEDQIRDEYIKICSTGLEQSKKNMGLFIKKIKEALPLADGKMVSNFVFNKLS